jgi:hypothetical protein
MAWRLCVGTITFRPTSFYVFIYIRVYIFIDFEIAVLPVPRELCYKAVVGVVEILSGNFICFITIGHFLITGNIGSPIGTHHVSRVAIANMSS